MTAVFSRIVHREPFIAVVGLSTAVIGHAAATSFFEWTGRKGTRFPLISLPAFLALTVVFYWVYENPLPKKLEKELRLKVFIWGALPWLLGALGFVFLFGFAAQLHEVMNGEHIDALRLIAFLAALLVAAYLTSILVRDQLMIVRSRYVGQDKMGEHTHDAKHLVILLSNVRDVAPKEVHWSGSLDDDLKELGQLKTPPASLKWSWEMPLHALQQHRKGIEAMTLICSPESIVQANDFARLVNGYDEFGRLDIRVWCERDGFRSLIAPALAGECKGFDFNDVNVLSSALVDLLKYLRFRRHLKSKEIMIDYTGGQKPASVVAAAVTLRGELRAQYIDTNSLARFEYDLVTNPEPKGG